MQVCRNLASSEAADTDEYDIVSLSAVNSNKTKCSSLSRRVNARPLTRSLY